MIWSAEFGRESEPTIPNPIDRLALIHTGVAPVEIRRRTGWNHRMESEVKNAWQAK